MGFLPLRYSQLDIVYKVDQALQRSSRQDTPGNSHRLRLRLFPTGRQLNAPEVDPPCSDQPVRAHRWTRRTPLLRGQSRADFAAGSSAILNLSSWTLVAVGLALFRLERSLKKEVSFGS